MVKDRLGELRQARPSLHSPPAELSVNGLASYVCPAADHSDDPFLKRVAQMQHRLEGIDGLVRGMLHAQAAILCRAVTEPGDKRQLDSLIDQIRAEVSSLRTNFRSLELELAEEENVERAGGGGGAGNAARRIRRNQTELLRRRLCEVLETFHSAQEDYRQRVTKRVRRQLELAGEHLETGEVEQLLEDKSEAIFYRHISPMNVSAQLALEDAASRHSELLRLEQSIGELTECFGDLQSLVHSQGNTVDRIETNVQSALEHTGQARVQINRAVVYKKSAQRFKCAIVLLLGALALVLLLLLIISFKLFLPNLGGASH